jgi:hypothetical protein
MNATSLDIDIAESRKPVTFEHLKGPEMSQNRDDSKRHYYLGGGRVPFYRLIERPNNEPMGLQLTPCWPFWPHNDIMNYFSSRFASVSYFMVGRLDSESRASYLICVIERGGKYG